MSISVKTCGSCKEVKLLGEFYSVETKKRGPCVPADCKTCYNKRMKRNRDNHWERYAVKSCVANARIRSEKRGTPFEVTVDSLWELMKSQNFKCVLSGIRFVRTANAGVAGICSPSLDRETPELGYVDGNVRFILHGLNALKGSGTDEELLEVCKAVVERASQ